MLTGVARALLAGRREIAAIVRFAQPLHPRQRRLRGLPVRKGTPALGGVPGSGVFAAVLGRLDHGKFAALLGDWPLAHAGTLPQALAMEGKIIRVHLGPLTLALHEDSAPQAVAAYDQKGGAGRCAQVVATALPEKLPGLDGKLLTAAALPCQKANARVVGEKGGEDLFQIKGVRPGWPAPAQALDARPGTPFLSGRRVATVGWKGVPSPRGPSRRAPSRSASPAASMWSAVRRRTGKRTKRSPRRAGFHRDRQRPLSAVTWLNARGLTCAPQRYRTLIEERPQIIAAHGDGPAPTLIFQPTGSNGCRTGSTAAARNLAPN